MGDFDGTAFTLGPPANAVYVGYDDNLRVTVLNALTGVAVTVAGRFQHIDGRVEPFEHRIVPTSDRVASVMTRRLAHGWILNVHAYVNAGAPITGQTFVVVSLVRGQSGGLTELATLAAGYVTATQRIAWPGSPVQNSIEGQGTLRVVSGTNPGAGLEVTETVPTGARWELISFKALLTTSVVAGTRIPYLVFDDGAVQWLRIAQAAGKTASLTGTIVWAQGYGLPNTMISSDPYMGLPTGIRLPAGSRIMTSTAALDAGDTWTVIRLLIREWIEGA